MNDMLPSGRGEVSAVTICEPSAELVYVYYKPTCGNYIIIPMCE